MKTKRLLPILLVGSLLSVSCGSHHYQSSAGTPEIRSRGEKIKVDAYLFDARLWRNEKPTSFRLEIYQADTIVALGGRGYLGKGAIKGSITADSLTVYFPSSNEYLREPIENLLGSLECAGDFPPLNFLNATRALPSMWVPSTGYVISIADSTESELAFRITQENCLWELLAEYQNQGGSWYLDALEFDNGSDTRFTAHRRTLKRNTEVDFIRFEVPIPSDAHRIIP